MPLSIFQQVVLSHFFIKLLILCNGFVSLSLAHSLLGISVVASSHCLLIFLCHGSFLVRMN